MDDGLQYNSDHAAWVPNQAEDFQIRVCIAGRTGPSGHRGQSAAEKAIREPYFRSKMKSDIITFVKSCIHCVSTIGGEKILRPFGPAMHGIQSNDLLQFDYLEMAHSDSGEKYLLLLRDDFSSHCWLIPFEKQLQRMQPTL